MKVRSCQILATARPVEVCMACPVSTYISNPLSCTFVCVYVCVPEFPCGFIHLLSQQKIDYLLATLLFLVLFHLQACPLAGYCSREKTQAVRAINVASVSFTVNVRGCPTFMQRWCIFLVFCELVSHFCKFGSFA